MTKSYGYYGLAVAQVAGFLVWSLSAFYLVRGKSKIQVKLDLIYINITFAILVLLLAYNLPLDAYFNRTASFIGCIFLLGIINFEHLKMPAK